MWTPTGRHLILKPTAILLLFYSTCFCSVLRSKLHSKVLVGNRISSTTSLHSSLISESEVARKLKMFKAERDQKRNEMLASNLAAEKAEMAYREYRAQHYRIEGPSLTSGTYDYGFNTHSNDALLVSKNSGLGGSVPSGIITLAINNFKRELGKYLRQWLSPISTFYDPLNFKPAYLSTIPLGNIFDTIKSGGKDEDNDLARNKLKLLKLDNEAIWEREKNREKIEAPWVIEAPYLILCYFLDVLFDEQPMARFYTLETVARMPYFSYISMLQLYETLGWWRRSSEAKRIHFAEEYNEFNHLLIMEALGGDQLWRVRFFAQHAAVAYYFILILVWATSPTLAYNFSELIEAHAVDTYAEFAESNKELLQTLEAPYVAKEYYENIDLYIFDEFQTDTPKGSRRPEINSLYDVFLNIKDDEAAHVSTMNACQNADITVVSSNTEAALKKVSSFKNT